ncbi:MAG: hypothetical protein RL722_2449 [Pseudomonadota bacterium]
MCVLFSGICRAPAIRIKSALLRGSIDNEGMSAASPSSFPSPATVTLRAPDGARASLLLQGGQLLSWQPLGEEDQLYCSPLSLAAAGAGQAVRGGAPVIFPQFSSRGPLPRHGFARTRTWTLEEQGQRAGHAFAVLSLSDDAQTRAIWPHAFRLELTASLSGRRLDLELAVQNTGETGFDFQAALHTYLRTADVRKAQLEGLLDQPYLDSVSGEERGQWIDVVSIAQEIDRIYWNAPPALTLREMGRRLAIAQQGFRDTVVWNPGPDKGAALADLPPEGWLDFLCVEAACIGEPVHLPAGEEWVGLQTLELA